MSQPTASSMAGTDTRLPERAVGQRAIYAVTIFVSAFLLFAIQPLIAKIILPWFGGSAAVWTTCLLFFQVALLLGYLYAHWTNEHLAPRTQAMVHVALVTASLLLLPVIPGAGWKPGGSEDPIYRILGLLAATVGLPYFLLSTTGPLVQAWYVDDRRGAFPYRLYALSNLGSMLALLSYPVVVEPFASTRHQAEAWSIGYGVFVALTMVLALRRRGAGPRVRETASARLSSIEAPAATARLLWVLLPACASALLLSVTNHLTQNIAAIPFLWILPLSVYLLSFIIVFDREAWYKRRIYLRLFALALVTMAYTMLEDSETTDLRLLIPLFAAALFIACMVCHGELARLKPHPRYLTSYYLMIALGGALGGVLVGFAAPHLFRGYYELAVSIGATAAVVLAVLYLDASTSLYRGQWRVAWAALLLVFGGLLMVLGVGVRSSITDYRVRMRSFYGGLRIMDEGSGPDATRKLMHGTINHGEQYLWAGRSRTPTTYYGPQTGVGLAIRNSGRNPQRVGVIGLGAGTLAAYGRAGDDYRFYDINPQVVALARSEFRFLRESAARTEVILGDARLSLEREPDQQFDVLAVDAFSGDAIPVHLLTREAFALYFRHLKPDGILAVHISNRYLNLGPVVEQAARAFGKRTLQVENKEDEATKVFEATWVLISGRPGLFDQNAFRYAGLPLETHRHVRMWTDDYSNLFQILK